MSNYTNQEANEVTLALRLLARLEKDHPTLSNHTKTATEDLIYIRDFIIEMVKKQS